MSSFDDIFNFDDTPIIPPAPEPAKVGDAWRKNRKWLEIRGITREELFTPCGQMERCVIPGAGKGMVKTSVEKPAGEDSKNNTTSSPKPSSAGKNSGEKIVGYGKYKDKSFQWIHDNDNRYFIWMSENVARFKKEADKCVKK